MSITVARRWPQRTQQPSPPVADSPSRRPTRQSARWSRAQSTCSQIYCGNVLDAVLGVSMTPTSVRTVLVAGAKADGVAVSHGNLDIAQNADLPSGTTTEQVISTILVTRETAAGGGYQVRSTGVTWIDVAAATALREGLATRRVDNVLLVSPFASVIS